MRRLLPILAIVLLALPTRPALSRPAAEHPAVIAVADHPELVEGRASEASGISKADWPDHARVRREIRQILASPEYNRTHAQSAIDGLQERAGKWLRGAILRFLDWAADHMSFANPKGAGILASLCTWAVVIGFIVLSVLVARWRVKRAGGAGEPSREGEGGGYQLPSAGPLIKQAAKLAEVEDYRGAFRAAYLASIAYLDGIRVIRFERSRTNWEYLGELKRSGRERLYAHLHSITLDFDRKIYGRETCARQDYLNAAAVYERLTSEAAR